MGLEVWITQDYDEMSDKAYEVVAHTNHTNPYAFHCFPTGRTPKGLKQRIIRGYEREELDFSESGFIHCDEYVGLPDTHKQSYAREIYEDFIRHLNFRPRNIYLIDGMSPKLDRYCLSIEERISKFGGIDLCVLGIGPDAHISFDMPGSSFDCRTRVTEISEETRRANARFFDNNINLVPKHAITIGIATIMESKRVMLLANGEHKADPIQKALEGEITEQVPASILQQHEDALFIIDRAAASKLSLDFLKTCNFY